MRYHVIQTIQSARDPETNPPVEVRYYTGGNLAVAVAALATAAVLDDNEWVTLLSVRLDCIEPKPEVPEYAKMVGEAVRAGWDFETDAALDDCLYWARADCAGPRVGVRYSDGVVVCERHVNNPPV